MHVMADTAFMTTAFARVAFSGDYGGTYFMTQLVGSAKARELYFLSERVGAEEALRLGLTNWVCPADALQAKAKEIARRLAKITDSPFVKVEATKFTEVGFHGRDVDQIIKDLVDNAMHLTKTKLRARFADEVNEVVENKIVDFMCGETSGDVTRDAFLQMYRDGALDHRVIELELPEGGGEGKGMELGGGGAMTPERVVIQLEKVRLF